MNVNFVSLLAGILLPALIAQAEMTANWPQFRGPGGCGVAEGSNLPDQWSATENVEWKTDIPGRGWSSPIAWGNRVFLTTVVSLGELEAAKRGLYLGGNRKDAPDMVNQWKVYCLDLDSGRVLWERQVHEGKPIAPIHIKNSYASETPVTDGERVYAYFGNVGLWCFDYEGKEIWTKPVEPRMMSSGWGTAASPILYEDRLYVVNDNEEDSYILALDKKTGKEIWRTSRDEKSNWPTPFLWANDKRKEIVTAGSGLVRSYDLDGKLLWSLKGMSGITISTPFAYKGLVYISSGYVGDKHKPLYAIKPGATGDISLAEGTTSNEYIAWSLPQGAPYNPTALAYKDRLFVLTDGGFLACYNAADGSVVYDRTRIPEGRTFTSSPWAYNDKIFCLNEYGTTFVLKAGDQFELLRKNPLGEDEMVLSTPAILGDRLLIRTAAKLYCIRNGAGN